MSSDLSNLEGEVLAAVDLGSNSFHMIVARYQHGGLHVIDRLQESVRLASGLRADGSLAEAQLRGALECLSQFGQRIANLKTNRVRAVATQTVRQLKSPQAFLMTAETALGHPIEIISGREEARLIYLGVSSDLPNHRGKRLVIDIGGASTEFIIGEAKKSILTESLRMGCVATTRKFFEDGKITRKRWEQALTEISVELQQFATAYRLMGWNYSIGSSGTIKAIARVAEHLQGAPNAPITIATLNFLRDRLIDIGDISKFKMQGINENRRVVLAGGVTILSAAFEVLRIDQMQVSESALREGLLQDLLGRAEHRDPREASIMRLVKLFNVDWPQANRVRETALLFFDSISNASGFDEDHRLWLDWCARVHEIGLGIAHSQHHLHAAYILENSDLAGFTRQEQIALSFIVRNQRRKPNLEQLKHMPHDAKPALLLTLILRLAVLFHRARDAKALPTLKLLSNQQKIVLSLPKDWLSSRPLTRADLFQEVEALEEMGFELSVLDA